MSDEAFCEHGWRKMYPEPCPACQAVTAAAGGQGDRLSEGEVSAIADAWSDRATRGQFPRPHQLDRIFAAVERILRDRARPADEDDISELPCGPDCDVHGRPADEDGLRAAIEALALLLETHADLFVTVGRRMGLPFNEARRAKHAGYMEAASILRANGLAALAAHEPTTPTAEAGDPGPLHWICSKGHRNDIDPDRWRETAEGPCRECPDPLEAYR